MGTESRAKEKKKKEKGEECGGSRDYRQVDPRRVMRPSGGNSAHCCISSVPLVS